MKVHCKRGGVAQEPRFSFSFLFSRFIFQYQNFWCQICFIFCKTFSSEYASVLSFCSIWQFVGYFCAREFRKVIHVCRIFLYFHKFGMFHTFNNVIQISFRYLNPFQHVCSIFWYSLDFPRYSKLTPSTIVLTFKFTKCLNFLHFLNYDTFFLCLYFLCLVFNFKLLRYFWNLWKVFIYI